MQPLYLRQETMAVGLFVFIFSFIKLVIAEHEGFIVGGEFVQNIKEFPHVAFLELEGSDGTIICGSSILNQYILITAAHCLNHPIEEITAFVGSINREQGTPYQIESYKQHPKWDVETISHDLGLLKLQEQLKFGQTIKRVLLLKNPPKTKNAYLASWGAVEEKPYRDTVMLKHTVQRLWNNQQCKTVIYNIPKGTICGGETRAKDFASIGDSGSGLLVKNKIIVGVVSYKEPSVSSSLVVYTDVAYYYKWIVKTSRRLYCA